MSDLSYEEAMERLDKIRACYESDNYAQVLSLSLYFIEGNFPISDPYMYSATSFLELVESGEHTNDAYKYMSMAYHVAQKGLTICEFVEEDYNYSFLHYCKARLLYFLAIQTPDPDTQIFDRRMHNDLVVLDAIDSLKKATNLPEFAVKRKQEMLIKLNDKKIAVDPILLKLSELNSETGIVLDAMELCSTMTDYYGEGKTARVPEAITSYCMKYNTLGWAIEKCSGINEEQRTILNTYNLGLFLLCGGKEMADGALEQFSNIREWNPGGVVTCGIKCAKVFLGGASDAKQSTNIVQPSNDIIKAPSVNQIESVSFEAKARVEVTERSKQNAESYDAAWERSANDPCNLISKRIGKSNISTISGNNPYESFGKMKTMGSPDIKSPISSASSQQTYKSPDTSTVTQPYTGLSDDEIKKYENRAKRNKIILPILKIATWIFVPLVIVYKLNSCINTKSEPTKIVTYNIVKESNLRSSPAKGKNIVATIPKGSSVTVVENNGEWLKVRVNSKEGYIKSNLVSTSQQ